MYTRIVLGMLMASFDVTVTFRGVPANVPTPVQMLVPGMRVTPERPGSMENVRLAGASPLDWLISSAAELEMALNVILPLPRLVTCTLAVAMPRWQSSTAMKTTEDEGCTMG